MFKAKDIMTTNVISITGETGIYEAIRTMVEHNITGLPVVDDQKCLVGVISEKDVLSLLYNIKDKSGTVADFMTADPISFDADDSLVDIAECLIDHHFRRVPVLSQGKLVGIVSRKDIIAYILKLRHQAQPVV